MLNLLPSDVKPRAVNGNVLSPIGSLKAVIRIGNRSVEDHFHIHRAVSGALLSWRTAQKLGILPPEYPETLPSKAELPVVSSVQIVHPPCSPNVGHTPPASKEDMLKEFPTVFDGQIRTMPGEEFKIKTTGDAKPFCVSTPRTIPYAHMGPTKEELESQGIISKQTEPTDWCALIVVARKKNSDRIRLCVDFSSPLNRFVKRERFQSTPPAIAVADIAEHKANISLSWMHSKVSTNAHWTKIANFSQPSLRLLVGTSSCVPYLAFHRSVSTMTGGCTRPFKISLTSAV